MLGSREEAIRYYQLAAASVANLPDGAYGDLGRGGVAEGLKRANAMPA